MIWVERGVMMKILTEDIVHVLKAHLKVELDDELCKDKRVHVVCKQMEQPPVTLQENVFVFRYLLLLNLTQDAGIIYFLVRETVVVYFSILVSQQSALNVFDF